MINAYYVHLGEMSDKVHNSAVIPPRPPPFLLIKLCVTHSVSFSHCTVVHHTVMDILLLKNKKQIDFFLFLMKCG